MAEDWISWLFMIVPRDGDCPHSRYIGNPDSQMTWVNLFTFLFLFAFRPMASVPEAIYAGNLPLES